MIYLDNTATTYPKPSCVPEEVSKCIRNYCGNPGRGAHVLSLASSEVIYKTRCLLAEMFNCESENVVFTYNTTYAINLAIKSLLIPKSHIIISDIEHNSVLRPVFELSNRDLCSFSIFSTKGTDEDIIHSLLETIQDDTKMIICTHLSNVGCRRLPLKQIGALCKTKNIKFVVDGAQSAGVYDIDIKEMNISALCIPGHKGLYGPQGIGAILFDDNEIVNSVIEGGTGILSKEINMPKFLPEALEAGTLSTPCIAGLFASLNWLKSINISRIRQHEEDLYMYLLNELQKKNFITIYKMNEYPGNTLMFNINGLDSSYTATLLNNHEICVRSGYHCSPLAHNILNTPDGGAVRVGFSVFNTKRDVDSLCIALDKIYFQQKNNKHD
ncbi:MAG: aminotransferase class V-fold PLP-dependent enzyme [Clostridia bacterium]|nr:aminotransferase class V-fold PLP-dependent enzyme [Clostridia bacterium]